MANKRKTCGLTTAKPSPLECQLEEERRENDRQEADTENKQPVWWSHKIPYHLPKYWDKWTWKLTGWCTITRVVSCIVPVKCCHSSSTAKSIVPSCVQSTRSFFPGKTFSSSIRVNISSSHTTSSFPSRTPSSVLVHSTRTIGSRRYTDVISKTTEVPLGPFIHKIMGMSSVFKKALTCFA